MTVTVTVAVGLVQHGATPAGEPTFIVTRRRAGTHLGGTWELPGGKVEAGEPPVRALERELLEELGVAIEAPVPLTFSWYEYGERQVLLLFYEAHTRPGSPAPRPLAADALNLLTLPEVTRLDMPPANAPLARLLRARASLPADPVL